MKEKRIIYLIMGVSSILILLIGITTAWFTWQSEVDTNVTFEVSGLNITSTNTEITGTLYPTMDKNNGLVEEFTIKQNNNIATPVCANITLTLTTLPTELNHESFRYKIYNGTNLVGSGNFANTLEGETITIATSQPITTTVSTYKLYIWIDGENYDNPLSMGGKTFLFKLGITANQQQNACNPSTVEELNAPVLAEGMIPITYDGTNWVKADTNNTNNNWYNYGNKMWANAVMVTSSTRDTYMNADIGTTITEEDILAYYVWIPRYKYQLFNATYASGTSSQLIDVVFENGTSTTGTVTCTYDINGNESCQNKANGNYYTHPAFTFGSTELKGIWVGKFETTGSTTAPTVKPGISSLRSITVSSMYSTGQLFRSTDYLTTNGVSSANSHMMKNIEWGAVAYLKQSIYGLGITDITKNNNSSRYTGGGSGTSYKTNTGQSTTGNITGVYDMSGGAFEYVMGNYNKTAGDSGLTVSGVPAEYIDIYSGTSVSASHLGDALGETAGWYSDSTSFVDSSNPWFLRGGLYFYGDTAGVFNFTTFKVKPGGDDVGFRVVLSTTGA